jgi:hypothetical protein
MPTELATYSFLPWSRQGVSAGISETDTLGVTNGNEVERAKLDAELTLQYVGLDNVPQQKNISKTIRIAGPGDVAGVNPRAIVRTEPKSGVTNFEANGLAYIEFYEEDFLWRYTPAASKEQTPAGTRLRPWLALVVLRDSEYKLSPSVGGALAFITVNNADFNNAFHHETDTWAFAHVQMNNRLDAMSGSGLQTEVNNEVNQDPDVAVSRLLCPRKLQKTTGYTAFLIPAFETGRLAGLGLPVTGIKAQAPSWKKGAAPDPDRKRPYDFPVYHQWSFRTADYGDFESLVSILKPVVTGAASGKMKMDISNPGFGIKAGTTGSDTISMEAALRPFGHQPDAWPANPTDETNVNKLRALLNLSADLVKVEVAGNNPFFNSTLSDDPMLVPPVYGVWHAMARTLGPGQNPMWVDQLNLDFRYRAAAGLGVKIVQQNQEDFMNRAWQQVNKVNEANRRIQEAALSRMVNHSIYKKHLLNANGDKVMMVTTPVQHLVKYAPNSNRSVAEEFNASRVPNAIKSPTFRRIVRPGNKAERMSNLSAGFAKMATNTGGLLNFSTIINQFNRDETAAGALVAATLKKAPSSALRQIDISDSIKAAVDKYRNDSMNKAKELFIDILQRFVLNHPGYIRSKLEFYNSLAYFYPEVPAAIKTIVYGIIDKVELYPITPSNGKVVVSILKAKFEEVFGLGISAKQYGDKIILRSNTNTSLADIRPLITIKEVEEMQSHFNLFTGQLGSLPGAGKAPVVGSLDTVNDQIINKLNPADAMARKLTSTIKVWSNGAYVPLQKLKPVMAYPEFSEAVYNYLLGLSRNYILPNIEKLPNNCVTLLQPNQPFIEAFLAGMNHEMARELMWREYPTDQRGSYFRQFWSVQDNLFPQGSNAEQIREGKLDIKKMHEWKGNLGDHNTTGAPNMMVLVVRGEVFKKYPSTMVYAHMAAYDEQNPSGPRKLAGGIDSIHTKFPVFKAEIDPDISIFGFELSKADAMGQRLQPNESPVGKSAGYYFVFKERPGQTRFGLDDYTDGMGDASGMPSGMPATWDGLTWEHLVSSKNDLQTYHINFAKPVSVTQDSQATWNSNSADLAAILYQNPVLFARHAAEMLP